MKYTPLEMYKRMWHEHLKKRWRTIALAVFFMLLVAASTSAQPLLLKFIFDDVFVKKDIQYITYLPLVVIFVFTIQGVSSFYSTVIMNKIGLRAVSEMQKNLVRHFIDYDLQFYSQNNSGRMVSTVINDLISIRDGMLLVLVAIFRQSLTIIGLVVIMLMQDWLLTIISLSVFALAVYPIYRFAKRIRKLIKQAYNESGNLISRLNEIFQGIRTVKAYQKEEYEKQSASDILDKSILLLIRITNFRNYNAPIMLFLAGVSLAGIIWYGGYELIAGRTTQGQLVAFLGSLLMISRPIKSMTSIGGSVQGAIVAAEKYYTIIDMKHTQIDTEKGSELVVKSAEILFKDVKFSYNDNASALNGINFHVAAGERVALVGPSGSGKTTVFNMLLRFFEPNSGKVIINNQDIGQVSIKSLRKNIALVSQDIFIFEGSIKNNIAYGTENATEDKIKIAAKAAFCDEFIDTLPNGYDENLNQLGGNLSGGQKQRISIARAFLRDAPILLLDEATSALDPKAERKIQEALDGLMKGRTTIMIAHRLSTVMKADKVVFVNEGKIVDSGTHEELVERSELYRNLFGV